MLLYEARVSDIEISKKLILEKPMGSNVKSDMNIELAVRPLQLRKLSLNVPDSAGEIDISE